MVGDLQLENLTLAHLFSHYISCMGCASLRFVPTGSTAPGTMTVEQTKSGFLGETFVGGK